MEREGEEHSQVGNGSANRVLGRDRQRAILQNGQRHSSTDSLLFLDEYFRQVSRFFVKQMANKAGMIHSAIHQASSHVSGPEVSGVFPSERINVVGPPNELKRHIETNANATDYLQCLRGTRTIDRYEGKRHKRVNQRDGYQLHVKAAPWSRQFALIELRSDVQCRPFSSVQDRWIEDNHWQEKAAYA